MGRRRVNADRLEGPMAAGLSRETGELGPANAQGSGGPHLHPLFQSADLGRR